MGFSISEAAGCVLVAVELARLGKAKPWCWEAAIRLLRVGGSDGALSAAPFGSALALPARANRLVGL